MLKIIEEAIADYMQKILKKNLGAVIDKCNSAQSITEDITVKWL